MSFLTEYFDIASETKEVAVCCPFDHRTPSGLVYKEHNPSAHVNTYEKLFHCKVCGAGYSEAQFIRHLLGCSYMDAKKIQRCFENNEDIHMWQSSTELTAASKQRALDLGISEEVISELCIATPTGTENLISFPVFMFGHLVDIRSYNPEHKPKVKSRAGCPNGLIIPYDIWRETPVNRLTLICAGEKDMALARTHGFNAITLTGGEGTLPRQLTDFKGRQVAIVYDNDGAGIKGAKKLALALQEYTPHVKVVTGFHEVCKEEKEDITDFFVKYRKTKPDLIRYIEETPYFVPAPEDLKNNYPVVDLLTACKPENLGRILQSNIQVVAVSEATFAVPSAIMAEKFKLSGEKDTMYAGEYREWELTEDTSQDILHLMDNNFKEDAIKKNIKTIMRIPQTERCVKMKTLETKTVFKSYVTDMFETSDTSTQPMEYTVYSIGEKLESGQKYLVTFKLVPHPYKGQQLTMIIFATKQANDSVSNFKLTPETIEHLDVIRNLPGNIAEKINLMTEKVKGLLGYNGNNQLIQTIDLAYHTVLQCHFGTFRNLRGYLDTIIVGESRVGKSSTAETLRNVYGLGIFTSLAGNSATIPGLVGGSNKTATGYQTRAGIIPQNHRGLIIFEEFGKSNANVITELTDIRSSNEVRITRVAGTITLPAIVRMIALTNPKNTNGAIKSIASYPHGISILTELVETAEDIARYDMIAILADKGNAQIDPFWKPEEPFPQEVYQTRVRWIWSRTPEQVIISEPLGLYLLEQANALNRIYECHIKIFGTEAWKKILRLSIAVAGYLVSTDESHENIIVEKSHIDFAVDFLKKLYDNPTFKLKEYVEHEKRYSQIDEEGVALLQDIYDKNPTLVLQLEQTAAATKNMLAAATGLNTDELNKAINRLTKGLFVKFANHDIMPTERFRLGLNLIERNTYAPRVGEY